MRSRYTFLGRLYMYGPRGKSERSQRSGIAESQDCEAAGRTVRGAPQNLPVRPPLNGNPAVLQSCNSEIYLISTLAPTSSNFFLIASASSLGIASLFGLGALSTR